jgi:hypothetical protein
VALFGFVIGDTTNHSLPLFTAARVNYFTCGAVEKNSTLPPAKRRARGRGLAGRAWKLANERSKRL